MKRARYYSLLVVVIGILCVPALAETEVFPPDDYDYGLIGQANPALVGIDRLLVVIVSPDSEPNKDGLVLKELETQVISKLNKAGIKIGTHVAGSILNIPELRVYVDMLKLEDLQRYVFRIQTSLATRVSLSKEPQLCVKADVWRTDSAMQAVSVQSMPTAVTNVVLEQVEAFIHTWLAANPKGKKPVDANSISVVPQKRAKPAVKLTTAKYQYVASKNSKVFHKPQCSSARRISPKNLIGYHSRQEVIKAGKRPCKMCKP